MLTRIELRRYKTPSGRVPFSLWLADQDDVTAARLRACVVRDGDAVVVLLCAGVKGSQHADIQRAHEFAADYWERR
jgi:hypothetical protein